MDLCTVPKDVIMITKIFVFLSHCFSVQPYMYYTPYLVIDVSILVYTRITTSSIIWNKIKSIGKYYTRTL